jgi:uncharacterized lipoprotein YmbA
MKMFSDFSEKGPKVGRDRGARRGASWVGVCMAARPMNAPYLFPKWMRAGFQMSAFVVSAAIGLALFSGCSASSFIPDAKADPTRFFVLSAITPTGAAASANAPTVQLRQIELASYLRTRPMIVRKGNNEIEFREFARWGEPLEQGIARILREELLAKGAAANVAVPTTRLANGPANFEVSVRVLACEGAANGGVDFHASWEVGAIPPQDGAGARGNFHPTDLHWDGKSEASLAAALSKAVAGLAGDIAPALKK